MKILTVVLTLILVVSLLTVSIAAVDVPTSATPLAVDYYLRFISSQYPYNNWYSSDTSTLMSDWQDGSLNDQSPIVYPAVIFSDGFITYDLQDTTTYYMQYELTTESSNYFFGMTTNASFYKLVPESLLMDLFGQYTLDETQAVEDPREYDLVTLSDVAREITTEVSQIGSNKYRVGLIFSTKNGVAASNFSAMLFTSVGTLDESDRLEFLSFQAWTDESLSIYEDLINGQLTDINSSIKDLESSVNDAADQAHDDAEDIKDGLSGIHDTLIGDPYQDNTGFNDELDNLKDIEQSIQDAVFNDITASDGTTIKIDGNVLTNIKNYLVTNFNPQDYDSTAGAQISTVFETFIPYFGIVVWFNLALGLALGFIRGRTDA